MPYKPKPEQKHRGKNPQAQDLSDANTGTDRGESDPNDKYEEQDVSVQWDPWNQEWVSTIQIISKGPNQQGYTRTYEKRSPDYPINMQVKHEVGTSQWEREYDLFWDRKEEEMFSEEMVVDLSDHGGGANTVQASVVGVALGTGQLEQSKDKIYDWKSDMYQVRTYGGKPVTVVAEGSLISGSQLNELTNSQDYDINSMYEVKSISHPGWWDGPRMRGDDPTYTNVNSFVNRNKGTGLRAEWTPSTVAVELEVMIVEDLSKKDNLLGNFNDLFDQSLLAGCGVDNPEEWTKVSEGYEDESESTQVNEEPNVSPHQPEVVTKPVVINGSYQPEPTIPEDWRPDVPDLFKPDFGGGKPHSPASGSPKVPFV